MTTQRIPLGTRTIEDVHESAIQLWIAAKQKNPESNPAHGIYFAFTNEIWPAGVPEVSNAIDLCDVLSEAMGQPRLTDGQKRALEVKAIALFEQHKSGRSPIRLFSYITWANRIAYLLGTVSLVRSGFSWWVGGLIVATWWCFGAARGAAAMGKQETRPAWELPVIAWMHVAALLALVVTSIVHILK